MIAAPLYHMNGLALAQLASAAHITVVLLPQFEARAYIRAIGEHRAIRDAIVARDPQQAREAMQHHLQQSQSRFSASFEEEQVPSGA